MIALLEQQLLFALNKLKYDGLVPVDLSPRIAVTRTRMAIHGDLSSNLAMLLAGPAGRAPRDIADALVAALPANDSILRTVVAEPGFINFYLAKSKPTAIIETVLREAEHYGRSRYGEGRRVHVVFASAIQNRPLSVGHARGATLGNTVANLLKAVGFDVQCEYSVNDTDREVIILTTCVWLRYLERCGEIIVYPAGGPHEPCVSEIANALFDAHGNTYRHAVEAVFETIDVDEPLAGDGERQIDALIDRCRQVLGSCRYLQLMDFVLDSRVNEIKDDLHEVGVSYDTWSHERSREADVSRVIDAFADAGYLYRKDGDLCFRSSDFGDDRDRVVVRANGQHTDFARNIADINDKFQRGANRLLYVVCADYRGYTERLLAACEALSYPRGVLQFVLVQFTNLYHREAPDPISLKSESMLTLRDMQNAIGKDAARYFYAMRKCSRSLNLDLDLAKSQSFDNPVYYVQSAYARICSAVRQLNQQRLEFDQQAGLDAVGRLVQPAELELMTQLTVYPEILQRAALAHEPQQIAGYLMGLANRLHSYYNAHKVVADDSELRHARICLLLAVKQVLANSLTTIGVSTPEVM